LEAVPAEVEKFKMPQGEQGLTYLACHVVSHGCVAAELQLQNIARQVAAPDSSPLQVLLWLP
jgi:hypothetical protein